MIVTLLAFLFVLFVVILWHEFGHFAAAKLTGVRVEAFSLGFPPHIGKVKLGETDYCIGVTPLGGYVKMSGIIDESLDAKQTTGAPWEFQSKGTLAKAFIMSAGVAMNFVLAIIIFSTMAWLTGVAKQRDDRPIVGGISPSMPAQEVGIESGDEIVSINAEPIETWSEMTEVIHGSPGAEMVIEVRRGDELLTFEVTSKGEKVPFEGKVVEWGYIGIEPVWETIPVSPWEALNAGWNQTYFWIRQIFTTLKMLITGNASMNDLGGPLAIAQISGNAYRQGGFTSLLNWTAILSINLGLLNLLPIPALDGGHLVVIGIEAILRRPLSNSLRIRIQQVGMAFLLVLILFIIFNDIVRIL